MRKLTNPKTKSLMFAFESMTEVVTYCNSQVYRDRGHAFMGEHLPTWEHVDKRSRRHWAGGLYTINQYKEQLMKEELPDLKSHKRKTQFNTMEGDEVDMDRLMTGQSEFWRSSEREETRGPTEVTVYIDTTTPGFERSDNIFWRGAAALALTEVLEEKGYTVELWCVNGSYLFTRKPYPVHTACCLKRCSDPLDVSTLCNTVAGWFYRSVTFTLLETIARNEHEQYDRHGLGGASTPRPSDLDLINQDAIRIYSAGFYSFRGALDMLLAQMQLLSHKD